MITDRGAELRVIEAKPKQYFTDDDIVKLASAYAYASGIAPMRSLWIHVLRIERDRAIESASMYERFTALERRIIALEVKTKEKK